MLLIYNSSNLRQLLNVPYISLTNEVLKEFKFNNIDKNVRNKIKKSYRRGLKIEKIDYYNLSNIYPFFKNIRSAPAVTLTINKHTFIPNIW